jgi:hypothetical protein
MKALFSPNASIHAFDVLIKPETEGNVSATVLGLPEYRAIGSDYSLAITLMSELSKRRTV